jgi:hypothetical protein
MNVYQVLEVMVAKVLE